MKGSVVVTCPVSKEPVRLMPGSTSLELYYEWKKNPKEFDKYNQHMIAVGLRYKKEIGK